MQTKPHQRPKHAGRPASTPHTLMPIFSRTTDLSTSSQPYPAGELDANTVPLLDCGLHGATH